MKWVWLPAPRTLIGPSRCHWEQSTVALQNMYFRFVTTGDCNENTYSIAIYTHSDNINLHLFIFSVYVLYTRCIWLILERLSKLQKIILDACSCKQGCRQSFWEMTCIVLHRLGFHFIMPTQAQRSFVFGSMCELSYCKDLGWSDWGILTMPTVASTDTFILIEGMYSSCKAIINHSYLSLLCVEV